MRPVAILLLLAAPLCGCSRQTEFAPPPPPEVTVSPPLARPIEPYLEYIGRTQAVDSIDIRARVKGFLLAKHFEPGDVVEKDQLLFTIEPDAFEAGLQTTQAEQAQEEANLQLADATLQRMEKALEKNAVSVLDVIQARADKAAAEAAVKGAQAKVADADLDLSYTQIHAPITGRISREFVDPGNLVGAGDNTLLATLVSDDPIYVYFNVDERTLLQLAADRTNKGPDGSAKQRPVELILADGSTFPQRGALDYVSNRVDKETGTLEIRASFPNPGGLLIPGLFGRVRVLMPAVDALLVPEVALQRDLAGYYLMLVGADGKAERRNVTPGLAEGDLRAITAGLEPGDLFIYRGLQRARDDMPVTATEETFPVTAMDSEGADADDGGAPAMDPAESETLDDDEPAGG